MAALTWDKTGERFFETGIDRGVIYLDDKAVVWNGLTSVEEQPNVESTPYYLDGVKYLHRQVSGGFSAKVKAFTYPEEFDLLNGVEDLGNGLLYYDQETKAFNMSYRTRVGNDLNGSDHAYKIHVLYNVIAAPDPYSYESIQGDSVQPVEMSWSLSGTPISVSGHKSTCHIAIDTRYADPQVVPYLESVLYGSETADAFLPDIEILSGMLSEFGSLIIIDNGDGTWTALDLAGTYITMNDPTTFTIDNANAVYSDASTYTISTTTPA